MHTPVEKLTSGIRQRQARSVEQALRDGANPDACVPLAPEEQFGTERAPVLYLAVHHDFPEAVRLLIGHGATLQNTLPVPLTPRVHAAWKLHWQCLDVFDEAPATGQDDDLVLSTIISHWGQPLTGRELEHVFFHRMDLTSQAFSMTPEFAMCLVVGVLFGWDGYRVPQLRRLLSHVRFQAVRPGLTQAVHTSPERFAPHYANMHRQARRFTGARSLPDQALEMLAEYNIPMAPPGPPAIDPEASAWLCEQQARVDALACEKTLRATTPDASSQTERRGRSRL